MSNRGTSVRQIGKDLSPSALSHTNSIIIPVHEIDTGERGRILVFLIPQFTNNGSRLYRGNSGPAIDFLETYLIGIALRANSELSNKRDTKLYREVMLPGFLNSTVGSPGKSANKLRNSLRF